MKRSVPLSTTIGTLRVAVMGDADAADALAELVDLLADNGVTITDRFTVGDLVHAIPSLPANVHEDARHNLGMIRVAAARSDELTAEDRAADRERLLNLGIGADRVTDIERATSSPAALNHTFNGA